MNQSNNETFTKPPSPVLSSTDPISQTPVIDPQGNEPSGKRSGIDNGKTIQNQTATITNGGSSPAGNPVLPQSQNNVSLTQANPPQGDSEENPEETEVATVKKNYKLTPKFNRWCECFFDKKNLTTYMNKTQSAISAYNLDPKTEYGIAASMGYQNFIKLQHVASRIADDKGYTFEKWLDKGWLQVLKSESPEWWDRLGDVLGYRALKPTTLVQNNTQNNTIVNVSTEDKKTFNDQFRSFIKST